MVNINSNNINNKIQIKQANKDWVLYFYLLSMLLILFLRNAIGVNIPVVFLLFPIVIPTFFGDLDHIMATAICCIPMSTGFQYKYALFICVIMIFFRYRRQIRLSKIALPIFLMMVWELVHGYLGIFSFSEYLRNFAELTFLATVLCTNLKNVNQKLIYRSLAVSTIGICLIMLYLQLQQFGFDFNRVFERGFRNFRFGQGNTTAENYGLNFNPNGLGYICSLTIANILQLFGQRDHSMFDLVFLLLSVAFGLMTLSRTFVIILVFIFLYFIFTTKGTISQRLLASIGTIVLATIAIWLINKYLPSISHSVIARFKEENVLNSRDTLFQFYNKHILSSTRHFLFGIGLLDYREKIRAIHNVSIDVAHNGIQEIWVVWGIVGVFLFFWMLVTLVIEMKKYEPHPEKGQFLPLGVLLLSSMAGQLISSEIKLLSLTIIVVCLSSRRLLENNFNDQSLEGCK